MRHLVSLLPLLALGCRDHGDSGAAPSDTVDTAGAGVCAELGLPVRSFVEAEDDDSLFATAADFTVPTRSGDFTLSEHWTGCDVYLFIQDAPTQTLGWSTGLWERDVDDLFAALPDNVHLFFLSTATSTGEIEAALDDLQESVDEVLQEDFDEEARAWWESRVHYVTERAQVVEGWIGDTMWDPGWGTAIDRFQRLRYIGSYADYNRYDSSVGWFEPNLKMAANEALYYNYEAERAEALEALAPTTVTIFEDQEVDDNTYVEVELPGASELSAYDTVHLECHMGCGGEGEYGYCPAWDYMAYLYLCSEPAQENPWSDTACQPEVEEGMGECTVDGEATGESCTTDEDCGGDTGLSATCEGYQEPVEADTQEGTCLSPLGEEEQATYVCNEEGTGYEDLDCSCDTEVGRWITTYHREGRWIHDISPMLPLLDEGGTRRFRFNTDGPYQLDVDLHFSNQGLDARPDSLEYLFSGGTIDEDYNDGYEPVEVEIPADATQVELVTVITQHGADSNNCGEFCDIAHHFTIDGDTDDEIVRDFPEAGTADDCMQKVTEGTVPNQYGTWWYGRAGWCPGMHVEQVRHDLTDRVTPGGTASIDYYALYQGQEYTGSATIRMRSWLLFSQ